MESQKNASEVWGESEVKLREGMLSVFLKGDYAERVMFTNDPKTGSSGQAV